MDALKSDPVCGTDLLRWGMARGAARIAELRQAGEQIITRPCQLHQHATHQVVYEMADKDQMSFSW
jgi:hypothetical protein